MIHPTSPAATMTMKLLLLVLPCLAAPAVYAQPASQPKLLKFAISSASNPGGKGSYSGTVTFSRSSTSQPYKVVWALGNGSTQTGLAVPHPDSNVIAVGYGTGLTGVAIYKKDGSNVDARWSSAKPGSAIGAYKLTRGQQPGVMIVENNGGTVTLGQGPEETGTVEFNLTTGKSSGIAIGQDDFLALAAGDPGVGVVIYKKTPEGAEGRWTVGGIQGAGTENLKILEVDGQTITDSASAPAAIGPETAGNGEEAEVLAIAKAVRGNKEELLKLKPTRAQLADITATPEDTQLLETYVKSLFADLPEGGLKADDDETKIVVFTTPDLPGGYAQKAKHLKPAVKIYGFKYLHPDKDAGTSFDGLVKVRGKWIMVPKLWRAFK